MRIIYLEQGVVISSPARPLGTLRGDGYQNPRGRGKWHAYLLQLLRFFNANIGDLESKIPPYVKGLWDLHAMKLNATHVSLRLKICIIRFASLRKAEQREESSRGIAFMNLILSSYLKKRSGWECVLLGKRSIARQCNVNRGMNDCFECCFLFPSGRDQTSFIRMWFVKFPVSASILSIFIEKNDKFLFHFRCYIVVIL